MTDILDIIKKNIGMDEEKENKEEQETIIVPDNFFL